MTTPAPVLCLGEILIDLIGHPPGPAAAVESFVPRVGGAPANVAVALARLGVPSAFVGAVAADDPFAPVLLDRLATEGVDTRWVRRVSPAQTRLAVVTGPAGQRGFTFYGHPPADSLLSPDDLPAEAIAGAAALYLGALPLTTEPSRSAALRAVDLAIAAGVPVCFDPNPRPQFLAAGAAAREACWRIARAATVLKLSAADLTILGITTDDLPDVAPRARLRVLSHGAAGCDYWTPEMSGHQPAFVVQTVDETGAGDAFTAALIARGVATGFHYSADDIAFAAAVGALATTRHGAIDALPTTADVAAFLARTARDHAPRQDCGTHPAGS